MIAAGKLYANVKDYSLRPPNRLTAGCAGNMVLRKY